MSRQIYTIDSRNCVFLETIKMYFHIADEDMHNVIGDLHDALVLQLKDKKLDYYQLKPALTPNKKRKELVLVFDSTQIGSSIYGEEIFNAVLKTFDSESIHSILHGDYIDTVNSPAYLYHILSEIVDLSNVNYQDSAQFFLIYLNNVNNTFEQRLQKTLSDQVGFVGIADVTYSSAFKTYLSLIIGLSMIKYKDIIIQDTTDYHKDFDQNQFFYDFEGAGFKIKNIRTELFDTFLSYKIERPYFSEDDTIDQAISLNAIAPIFKYLQHCEICVDEAKIEYLKLNKRGTLHNIGFDNITSESLKSVIKRQINSNYIYSMQYDERFETAQFNIMLEFKSHKILLGLKYLRETNTIHLITMF